MSDPSPLSPPPGPRIPFSPAYLVSVGFAAMANAAFFALLAKRYQDPNNPIEPLAFLSIVFGILFAGACNLSALSLAKWLHRREAADRILLFLLTEILVLTVLALASPYVIPTFGRM